MTAAGDKHRRWSDEEDEIVRKHYGQGGAKACAPLLPHRSYNAIQLRAACLEPTSFAADIGSPEPKVVVNPLEALKRDISESRRALTAAEGRYALALRNYALFVTKQRRDHVHERKVA